MSRTYAVSFMPFASQDGLGARQPEHDHVVRVLGGEPLEIARVVGVELTLGECCGVEGCGHGVQDVRRRRPVCFTGVPARARD